MSDGLKTWNDVIKRVDRHDTRIAALEKNDARQDEQLRDLNLDIAQLADIVHRARKRARAKRRPK